MQKLLLLCCRSENRATSQIWKVLPNMVFPPIWGGKWRRSEHAHESYPGLFFRPPGLSPYKGREERRVQALDYACVSEKSVYNIEKREVSLQYWKARSQFTILKSEKSVYNIKVARVRWVWFFFLLCCQFLYCLDLWVSEHWQLISASHKVSVILYLFFFHSSKLIQKRCQVTFLCSAYGAANLFDFGKRPKRI